MKKRGQPGHFRLQLPPVATGLVILLLSLLITGEVILIQPGSFPESIAGIYETPLLILLNLLPILVLVTALGFLTGNVFAGGAITALVADVLSYANTLKIEYRTEPVIPSDITLLKESLNAAGEYGLELKPGILLLIAATVLACILLAVLFKSSMPKWYLRIAGVLIPVAVLTACIFTIYADKDYYEALPNTVTVEGQQISVSKSNVPQVFNTFGFPYCFLHNVKLYPIEKPEGYSAAEARSWEESEPETEAAEAWDVDIVIVMGEAFTDLAEEAAFTYTEEESPLWAYHQVADSDQAVSGHIVVSNFGAGTANTEFDVMTGMQTNTIALSNSNTSAFRCVKRDVDSLARIYTGAGSAAWFMHPGYNWFYNRCNVYSHFGVEDQTFVDAFDQSAFDGSYVRDLSLLEYAEEALEQHSDSAQFAWVTTIENHQAYYTAKYSDPVTEVLQTELTLSDEATESLTVYCYGVRHTSEMLLQLTEYLNSRERPTLLVFFGDHRPTLGADYAYYREIGSEVGLDETLEQQLYKFETPFVIWGNTALCSSYDFSAAVEALDLPENHVISSSYLGSLVYELTGRSGSSCWWDYLCEARRILPVNHQTFFVTADGTLTDTLTEEEAETEQKLRCWQYYRLKNGID